MKHFNILKNMSILNNISARLASTTSYGIIIKYEDYLNELNKDTNYDFIVNSSLIVTDNTDNLGYKIIFTMDDEDPSKITKFYDDELSDITARLFVDTAGYVGIIVYNISEEGIIDENDCFVLCIYDYDINPKSDTEDIDDVPYYPTKYYS